MEKIVILGSGPAGLTAAIYAARANLNPMLIEGIQPGGQLTDTTDVENFPGFTDPVTGPELMSRMRGQAERLGVRFKMDEAVAAKLAGADVMAADRAHDISLGFSGETVRTRCLVIATGATARYLGLPSEEALKGRGVSACATCDGSFYRGQEVAVVGGGDTALEEALYLSNIASKVTVIHRRDAFRASKIMGDRALANPNIDVCWNHVVEEVLDVGANEVSAVKLRDVKTNAITELPIKGLFIAIGHTPNTSIFKGVLDMDEDGYLVTGNTRTNVPGVFAAGDVQDRSYRQAITAAGTGCIAALEAERYLGTLSS